MNCLRMKKTLCNYHTQKFIFHPRKRLFGQHNFALYRVEAVGEQNKKNKNKTKITTNPA